MNDINCASGIGVGPLPVLGAPVGGPLRGNRRVSGWLPEAVVCFVGPPGSMGLTHTRPAAPTGVLSTAAVPGGSQPQKTSKYCSWHSPWTNFRSGAGAWGPKGLQGTSARTWLYFGWGLSFLKEPHGGFWPPDPPPYPGGLPAPGSPAQTPRFALGGCPSQTPRDGSGRPLYNISPQLR